MDNLRTSMENSFKLAQKYRIIRMESILVFFYFSIHSMDTEKINHDRKSKKLTYKIGPFEIKKVEANKIDYLIQRAGKKKEKCIRYIKTGLNSTIESAINHKSILKKDYPLQTMK